MSTNEALIQYWYDRLPASAPAPPAEAGPKAQASAPARKQTLEEHLEEARGEVARYRKAAL